MPLVLIAVACLALPACRERDAHGTTERIWRTGAMRVGLPPDAAERRYPEAALLEQMAARMGARVEPFPAPFPDLANALAAGVIDVVVLAPPKAGPQSAARPRPPSPPSGTTRVDFTLRGRNAALLVRRGENRFLALCRRYVVKEAAGQEGPKSAKPPLRLTPPAAWP